MYIIMNKYDYLIVGAGLFGSTFAYLAYKKLGAKCLVIDKRNHLGGNLYCENKYNIDIHKYGPHIFHTSNDDVWQFVTSLVKFNNFINQPLAYTNGKIYSLPFNMHTFNQLWGITKPEDAVKKINSEIANAAKQLQCDAPSNLEEEAMLLVGKDIYNTFIKEYTEKQWGKSCKELPPFIINRLPIRLTYNNNYFNDKYQGIPYNGYNTLINKLLQNIETKINTNFFDDISYFKSIANKIVYTGKIDEFYAYKFGKLEYRSLIFKEKIINTDNFQGNAVVNYPDKSVKYTRIIEHKHFNTDNKNQQQKTIITYEFPAKYTNTTEPYYPINTSNNNKLYEKYKQLSAKDTNVIFGGRLAEYKYLDMSPIIESVFNLIEKEAKEFYLCKTLSTYIKK